MAIDAVETAPDVSIIVPARNEEASLGACLQSLTSQHGVVFEVIVVDDGSTDGTPGVARSFEGVRVVAPGPLPVGWSGKNHAVCAGVSVARGRWLLFTDADTVHSPGSLANGLAEAKDRNVDLLSYSPAQEVEGFWQKAVMPVIFAELAASFQPKEASDPQSPVAAANGQYILISRAAYDAIGGHASVAASFLEDVALARVIKRSGRRIFFRYSDAVRTHMYRSFSQMSEGWAKNLALLFPAPLRLAGARLAEFCLITASGIFAIAAAVTGRTGRALAFLVLAAILEVFLLRRIRRANFSWDVTLLSLAGLPVFSYFLVRSWFFYRLGSVTWKGRNYNTHEPQAEPASPCVPAEEF